MPVFAATELVDLSSEGTISTTETKIPVTTIDNGSYYMDVIAKAGSHGTCCFDHLCAKVGSGQPAATLA